MIRVTCDTCEKAIDRDADRWFGVDFTEPPPPIDEYDEALLTELKIAGDHERHFCSASCLSSWAFGQELEGETS